MSNCLDQRSQGNHFGTKFGACTCGGVAINFLFLVKTNADLLPASEQGNVIGLVSVYIQWNL